jgi:uncharacterized protein (TIGR01370 family)
LLLGQELSLSDVNDWCVQLKDVDLKALGETKYDLVVIDHSHDGRQTYVPADYATLRASPGGRKLALAYLPIGSAQTERFYWKKEYNTAPPSWLGQKDPARRDAFFAKYWDPEWQGVISGSKDGYLDRIIEAGFDGAVLDAVDSYAYWQNQGEQEAREKMIEWVKALGIYVRKKSAKFLLFSWGAEELLADGRFLASINGIVRPDAYHAGGSRRGDADIAKIEDNLDRGVKEGRKVLVLETVEKAEDIAWVFQRAKQKGYVAYCGPAGFAKVAVPAGHEPD